jgi:hypothetical protein
MGLVSDAAFNLDKKRPQFAGDLFMLSSLSARNARMALDLVQYLLKISRQSGSISHMYGVAHGQLDTTAGRTL